MVTMTSAEAQVRFGQLIETAQQEMVEITGQGRSLAFVVSPQTISDLLELRRKQAAADFAAWREAANRETTPEAAALAAALTDEEVNRLVHELR
jgi:hypothetical protein